MWVNFAFNLPLNLQQVWLNIEKQAQFILIYSKNLKQCHFDQTANFEEKFFMDIANRHKSKRFFPFWNFSFLEKMLHGTYFSLSFCKYGRYVVPFEHFDGCLFSECLSNDDM